MSGRPPSASLAGTDLVLRDDVVLVPVSDLARDVRDSLDADEEDVAVTRTGGRVPSTLVDRRATDLLERFSERRTLVEAVILHSRAVGADPEEVLEEAYGLVREMLERGVLVPAEKDEGSEGPVLTAGDRVASRFEVLRPLSVMEDTEVHLARDAGQGHAALKVARAGEWTRRRLDREARVLDRLEGLPVPEVRWRGSVDDRPAVALAWLRAAPLGRAAAPLRGPDRPRKRLADLCASVARAYADLHARNVVHGDVHGANVLVDRDGSVRLLDFGHARALDDPEPGDEPAGVAFYRAPEAAAALLESGRLPPPDPRSEQYAVGALLYEAVTGRHHHDFDLRRREMHEQIRDRPPLSFEERGAAPWPEMERVLVRALRRDPDDRFGGMAEMADALDEVGQEADGGGVGVASGGRIPSGAPDGSRLEPVLEPSAESGSGDVLPEVPPTVSVEYGAAGIAYVLLRAAAARDDPAFLAAAERWADRARDGIDREDAFYDESIEITEETVGRASLYHGPPGVHAVRAMVARALGRSRRFAASTADFLRASRREPVGPDLALGRSGLLLGTAILLDAVPEAASEARAALEERGRELRGALSEEMEAGPAPGEEPGAQPGIAHGWAGYLYALLCWSEVAGEGPGTRVRRRLEELAAMGAPAGRGAVWPWWIPEEGAPEHMPGWCNGSAGYVFLWSQAERTLGDDRYGAIARDAAWNAWESGQRAASLCCGLTGRAWAMLRLHRREGDPTWLRRARSLARRAREEGTFEEDRPWSLWKGRLALAALEADIGRPEAAACPLFEPEGWRRNGP